MALVCHCSGCHGKRTGQEATQSRASFQLLGLNLGSVAPTSISGHLGGMESLNLRASMQFKEHSSKREAFSSSGGPSQKPAYEHKGDLRTFLKGRHGPYSSGNHGADHTNSQDRLHGLDSRGNFSRGGAGGKSSRSNWNMGVRQVVSGIEVGRDTADRGIDRGIPAAMAAQDIY